jgi:hypothetical protein
LASSKLFQQVVQRKSAGEHGQSPPRWKQRVPISVKEREVAHNSSRYSVLGFFGFSRSIEADCTEIGLPIVGSYRSIQATGPRP